MTMTKWGLNSVFIKSLLLFEREDLFLLVANGAQISAQISQSRARVNDDDAVRIGEPDLQTRSVAAELLKAGIADGNRSTGTVELELHRMESAKVLSHPSNCQALRPFISGTD